MHSCRCFPIRARELHAAPVRSCLAASIHSLALRADACPSTPFLCEPMLPLQTRADQTIPALPIHCIRLRHVAFRSCQCEPSRCGAGRSTTSRSDALHSCQYDAFQNDPVLCEPNRSCPCKPRPCPLVPSCRWQTRHSHAVLSCRSDPVRALTVRTKPMPSGHAAPMRCQPRPTPPVTRPLVSSDRNHRTARRSRTPRPRLPLRDATFRKSRSSTACSTDATRRARP